MATEVGDILRIACSWLMDGNDEIVNVHHMLVEGVPGSFDDQDVMDSMLDCLQTDLYSAILDILSTSLDGNLITGINLTQNEILPPIHNTMDGTDATGGGIPFQVAGLFYMNGNQPRRQGRVYTGGYSESFIAGQGTWDATALDDFTAFAANLLTPLNENDFVFRRVISNASGSSFFNPTFAGYPADPRTQRRRTKGRGS